MHMWEYGRYGGGWGWLGPLLMLVFGILIVVGLVLLIRTLIAQDRKPYGGPGGGGEDAVEILKSRYARGEITRDEFERIKRDLVKR